jgi:hypothetical protein
VLNALDRLIDSYPEEVRDTKRDLAVSESQLVDYQQRLGKTFDHAQYMADLTGLRDQLRLIRANVPDLPESQAGTHCSINREDAAMQVARECRYIIQGCLREEEWQDADQEFYEVIASHL